MMPDNPLSPQPVVLDASVWVSYAVSKDRNHIAADAWGTTSIRARGMIIVPVIFRVEVVAAISRVTKDPRLSQREIAQLMRLSASGRIRFVPIRNVLIQGATDFAANFGLRAGDAVYAALAQQLGISLVTFDIELLSLPTGTVTTLRP